VVDKYQAQERGQNTSNGWQQHGLVEGIFRSSISEKQSETLLRSSVSLKSTVKNWRFWRKNESKKVGRHHKESESNHFFGKVGFHQFGDYDYRVVESLPILGDTDWFCVVGKW